MKKLTALVLGLSLLPTVANAWWNSEWQFRKKVEVDVTDVAKVDAKGKPTEMQVLVRLHPGNFQYFLDTQPDGADLRFLAGDDKTPLPFHIEKYDPVAEMGLIWVGVPRSDGAIANGPTTWEPMWMYYGNTQAAAGQTPADSFTVNDALVYRWNDAQPKDLTSYGNNPSYTSVASSAAGLIGPAAQFEGKSSVIVPSSPSLRIVPTNGWTFASWVKIDNAQDDSYVLYAEDAAHNLSLRINGNALYGRYQNSQTGVKAETAMTSTVSTGSWHHVGLQVTAEAINVYLDGVMTATVAAKVPEMAATLTLGGAPAGANHLVGLLDETRVASEIKSAEWFKFHMSNQNIGAENLRFGEDESVGSGESGGYMKTIMNSLTFDGWAVIFMCGIMAVVSWIVVMGKAILINRASRDNNRFLEEYRKLDIAHQEALDRDETEEERELENAPVMAALVGKHDHFQSSPLYHLYHVGMHEIKMRAGTALSASSVITPQGLAAIKAALDTALVREQQKFNKSLVFLTMSVSGGPFLGLLGTVLGVMITFAAIAETGDVNVAAIAPGVAAALAATVAGLAVAIPALFAYNFLSTRIRDLTIDMRVFSDELLAKIAERHS